MVRSSEKYMMKQAVVNSADKGFGPVSTPTLKNVLNLMLNPAAGYPAPFIGGTVYYPFKDKYPAALPLFQAVALATTYGGLGYVLRSLEYKSKMKQKTRMNKKRIAKYVSAQMPLVSPDPIRDPAREAKEELMGTEKLAMEKAAGSRMQYLSLLVPLAAMIAGTYGGYAMAGAKFDAEDKRQADAETAMLKDKLDKLNYEKMRLGRGFEKDAAADIPEDKYDMAARRIVDTRMAGKDILGFVRALAGLAAISVFSGSMYFSKKYFDDRDPARQRLDSVEKALRHKAIVETERAPVVIPNMPEAVTKNLERPAAGRSSVPAVSRRVGVSADALPPLPSAVDSSDTVMSKLMR